MMSDPLIIHHLCSVTYKSTVIPINCLAGACGESYIIIWHMIWWWWHCSFYDNDNHDNFEKKMVMGWLGCLLPSRWWRGTRCSLCFRESHTWYLPPHDMPCPMICLSMGNINKSSRIFPKLTFRRTDHLLRQSPSPPSQLKQHSWKGLRRASQK